MASPAECDPPYLAAFDRVQKRLAARLRAGEKYILPSHHPQRSLTSFAGSLWRLLEPKGRMTDDMAVRKYLV